MPHVAAEQHSAEATSAEDADLQMLLQQYEAQAAQDTQAVLQSSKRKKPLAQMSLAELRTESLANPIPADNKYASPGLPPCRAALEVQDRVLPSGAVDTKPVTPL